ncbi:MAG: hypothetical protein JXA21_13470 [Anaerolineae bacterium]|nr:hypothetical protein [Anaerolineae bacterium]
MLDRFINWATVEPSISLLMVIVAVALFSSAFRKSQVDADRFWPWLRSAIEAAVKAALFLGLLWAFRAILNNNNTTFNATHGSLTESNRQSAYSIWGRPHIQRELSVSHSVEKVVQEEVPREDPSLPPLYKNTTVREIVPQNSVVGFTGQVDMELSERRKGYALYSGYIIRAHLEYEVLNDSALTTDAEFTFPLSSGQRLFEDFTITVNDQDVSSDLRFSADQIQWTQVMQPQQRQKIVIVYTSRGMDTFYYQIPTQRNIQNFALTLTIDRLPVADLNYPEGILTPTEIAPTPDGRGSILTWRLDHAITTAGMGVALPQPEQPGAKVLRVLWNSPYALTLLGTMLALTLLILGEPLNFLDLALLAAIYSTQFLVMSAISDYFFGFWGSLALGAALTGFLSYLLFRKKPTRLLRALLYGMIAFFVIVYPLAGLLTETVHRNTFDNFVQIILIVYLFGLSLYSRSKTTLMEAQ